MASPIDEYGLRGAGLTGAGLTPAGFQNPYGLPMPPMMTAPMPPPAAPRPAGPPPRTFDRGGMLGPIGGPQGVGATAIPPRTVIPFPSPVQGGKGPTVGKDLPLEALVELQRKAESSGRYNVLNKEKKGNTASGAYQYTDATWNNYGGYPKAMLAPKEVQDRRFREDIAARVNRHQGDVFRTIAAHYLPAAATNPAAWDKPYTFTLKGKQHTVKPVAQYLRQVFKGTPYEGQIDAYIAAHK